MAEVKQVRHRSENDEVIDRARDFWSKNGRVVMIAAGVVILLVGGFLAYKFLIKAPKEQKADESLWKTEEYFRLDSLKQTLAGDGQFAGAEKVASQYSGTRAGNLAHLYAGAAALKAGDNNKAVTHLNAFSTDDKLVQARAYKLLGDAYANLGKNADALSNYKKAAHEFEADQENSAEYLFFAAYFADRVMNDKKQAIELYKEVKQKYPQTFGPEADKYLAQAGVYKTQE